MLMFYSQFCTLHNVHATNINIDFNKILTLKKFFYWKCVLKYEFLYLLVQTEQVVNETLFWMETKLSMETKIYEEQKR